MRGFGLLLIALGLAALVVGGVGITRRREVARVGRVGISVNERQSLPAARVAGTALLVAGVGLVIAGQRRRRRA